MEIVVYFHVCFWLMAFVAITANPKQKRLKDAVLAFFWPVLLGIIINDLHDFLERNQAEDEQTK